MKFIFSAASILSLAAASQLFAETNYTVFKVCEDQHMIRTSDGAEAGHVEYIVFDPAEQRIVSSVVSGGALGERMVAVPFSSMRFGNEREVVLTEITRERLVSAPVIERTQITTTARFEPAVVERSFTHFGVRVDATARNSTSSREIEQRRTTERERSERRGDPAVSARSQLRDETEKDATLPEGNRERMARERQGENPKTNTGRDGRRGDADRDRSRPTAEAAGDGARSPVGEARRSEARTEDPSSSAEARRSAPEGAGAATKSKADAAAESARPSAQEAARKARDVKGEAASKSESAAAAATDAAGDTARKAAKGAERATGAATDAARKAAPAKAESESRPPSGEKPAREKKEE